MSLFKQRKNKRFNLPTRASNDSRSNDSSDFSQLWSQARAINTKRKKSFPLGILFVILLVLIGAMYYIEKKYL